MLRRALPALLLALTALGAVAPTALALTQTDYAVTIEGWAAYTRADAGPAPLGNWTQDSTVEMAWRSTIPSVTFLDNAVSTTSVGQTVSTINKASTKIVIPTPDGPVTGACSGTSWETPPGPGVITGQKTRPEGAQAEGIFLTVLSPGAVRLASCSGALAPGPYGLSLGSTDPRRTNAWEQFFEMPHEAIGMGKIIQLLDRRVTGVNCPGYQEITESCTLQWNAKVTFVRTFHVELGEPVIKPAPPGEQPGPVQGGPPAPAPQQPAPPTSPGDEIDLDDIFIPMPAKARLDRSAAGASVPVVCRMRCRGRAVATPLAGKRRGKRKARAAAARTLARTAFTAEPGRATTVRLRFARSARAAIRRAGGVKVALTVHPVKGGKAQTRTITLRIASRGGAARRP